MIFVECEPDSVLAQHLTGLPKRQIVHELKGKYEVCKRLSEQTASKALVDEDPGANQPVYLQRITLTQDLPERGVKVFHDISKNNRLVVLCPKLEEWIVSAADSAGIDLRQFGLPNDPHELRKVVNVDTRKFDRLLQALSDAGSERIRLLTRLLRQN